MSTWAHVDQRWFIQCVKEEGRKGTIGPTKKKAQGLCAAKEPLSPDPSRPSLSSGRVAESLGLRG